MKFGQPLQVETTPIADLVVMRLSVHGDARGWFKENWQRAKFSALPSVPQALETFRPIQNNISFNEQPGVTRGLHAEPWDKLISVATGTVFGAWCDVRIDSATYGKTFSMEISPDIAVFVPRGVANGFQALKPDTSYTYLVNAHWSPQATYVNVNAADPDLDIPWPIPLDDPRCIRSEKDLRHPNLAEISGVQPPAMLIIGAQGQVGRALQTQFPAATALDAKQLDLTMDFEALETALDWSQYSVVCNAAAYTKVDAAETHAAQCWQVNAIAVRNLAVLAERYDFCLVHFSTDYVFDGTASCYAEDAPLAPLNVYGQSKAAGELAATTTRRHYVLRTAWVVGDGNNFVRTMDQLAARDISPTVVNDQFGRLSFTRDIAAAVAHLLAGAHPYGVYNCTNSGAITSWFDIAHAVYSARAKQDLVRPVSTEDYGADKQLAARPRNSVLALDKLAATGFLPRRWEDALMEYLNQGTHINMSTSH